MKKTLYTLASIIVLVFIVLFVSSRPTETEDGSYIPSPLALKLATSPTTDFENIVYENKYAGTKKVLMLCTEQKNMTMKNGKMELVDHQEAKNMGDCLRQKRNKQREYKNPDKREKVVAGDGSVKSSAGT